MEAPSAPAYTAAAWLAPLAFAALFIEQVEHIKPAEWVAYVSLGCAAAFLVVTLWAIASAKGARAIAAGCALINAPLVVLSAFTTGMAASGTWL